MGVKVSGGKIVTDGIDLNNNKALKVGPGTAETTDAVNMNQLKAAIDGVGGNINLELKGVSKATDINIINFQDGFAIDELSNKGIVGLINEFGSDSGTVLGTTQTLTHYKAIGEACPAFNTTSPAIDLTSATYLGYKGFLYNIRVDASNTRDGNANSWVQVGIRFEDNSSNVLANFYHTVITDNDWQSSAIADTFLGKIKNATKVYLYLSSHHSQDTSTNSIKCEVNITFLG